MDYFRQKQHELRDQLGIDSFLLGPIQRLPKYQLLLYQLIQALGKHLDDDAIKHQIALCCKAEKYIQRLLDRVNASMAISDIIEHDNVNDLALRAELL